MPLSVHTNASFEDDLRRSRKVLIVEDHFDLRELLHGSPEFTVKKYSSQRDAEFAWFDWAHHERRKAAHHQRLGGEPHGSLKNQKQ